MRVYPDTVALGLRLQNYPLNFSGGYDVGALASLIQIFLNVCFNRKVDFVLFFFNVPVADGIDHRLGS
jgi:hypothetical protein